MHIHSAYQQRAIEAGTSAQHQRVLEGSGELVLVVAMAEELKLQALVNPKTHVMEQAAFAGAQTSIDRGLLETLCIVMEGKPIQECADHAAIFAERALRDPAAAPLVPGLLTPDNGDPAFRLLQSLARQLRCQYAEQTGCTNTINFFDRRPSGQWRKLSEAARIDLLNEAIQKEQLSRQLRVLGVQEGKRVVVAFVAPLSGHEQQALLVKLETTLRQTVESTLQIMLETKSDTNVVRIPNVKKTK